MAGGEPGDHEEAQLRAVGGVELGGSVSRALKSFSASAVIPSPRSSMSTANPWATISPPTLTRVCGGENDVAFSMSSAKRWMMSPTDRPSNAISGIGRILTRA